MLDTHVPWKRPWSYQRHCKKEKKEFWKQMAHSIGERDGPEISKCLGQTGLMPKVAFRPH